ncbi:MAG TPA: hypothetical protein VK923_12780 [Euzebyales bacterium]|nr:hypothetical protein [Euzebyales bacterium]
MRVETRGTSAPASTVLAVTTGVDVPRRVRRSRVVRSWAIAWGGAATIGVANAVLREAAFSDLGELPAHQLSTVTLLVFLAAYMWAVERWRQLPSTRTAVQVGLLWAGLTVVFEFVLGLYVTKQPLSELLGAYNVAAGRLWALVPLWMAVGPEVVRRRSRTSTA